MQIQTSSPSTLIALTLASPAEVGVSAERASRLLEVLQSEVDCRRLPGAVVLISRHGRIALFESLGMQNPETATPMAPDSIFRIYSMTKPLVSVAIMMLMEQGRLLLSDPVAHYLPEFSRQQVALVDAAGESAGLRPVRRPATVHDLLRHTAGLTYEFMGDTLVHRQYAQARVNSGRRNNTESIAALAALPLLAEPGSVWEYSRATDVLGRLIEVLSGQSLGDFLRQHILLPLGMRDTGFFVPPADHGRIAEPFARDPEGGVSMAMINIRSQPLLESGGGGLVSTAGDYARFLQFMLNKGELEGVRLLGPQTIKFMTADHLGGIPVNGHSESASLLPTGHGFGLGFAVRTANGLASTPGSAGQYFWSGLAGTSFFVDPALDMFALIMVQAPNQREYYKALFRSLVYAALMDH